ncbi:MAG: hypothetical protein OEU54_11630 [Gemmatimonadota bacterium]|nr:hypothetical protein [Gemmatimonadota bacterium]
MTSVVFLAGCTSFQRISVETDPVGASVYLQRRGEIEVHGRVAGVVGGVGLESFEEDFIFLGNAPIDYEFERDVREVSVQSPEVGADVTRHYREGTIRVERTGYETVVRVVRFSGNAIVLVIDLLPVPDP